MKAEPLPDVRPRVGSAPALRVRGRAGRGRAPVPHGLPDHVAPRRQRAAPLGHAREGAGRWCREAGSHGSSDVAERDALHRERDEVRSRMLWFRDWCSAISKQAIAACNVVLEGEP